MVETPKIPTRTYLHGDKEKAKRLIGFGKKRYSDLVTFMLPRKLKTHSNTITLHDGSKVETLHNFGLSEIHLYAPLERGKEGEEFECKCGQYFAEGLVVGVTNVNGYHRAAWLYTVDVCQSGSTQVTVPNCVSCDFHEFSIGERVWVCLSPRELAHCEIFSYGNPAHCAASTSYGYSIGWGASNAYGYEKSYNLTTPIGYEVPWNLYTCDIGTCAYYRNGYYTLGEHVNGSTSGNDDGIHMCSVATIKDDATWYYKNVEGACGYTKNLKTLFNKYSMDFAYTGVDSFPEATPSDPPGYDPLAMVHPYNLQILPYTYLGGSAHREYSLRLGKVVKLNPDTNTVDVKILGKTHHYIATNDTSLFYWDATYDTFDTTVIYDTDGNPSTVPYTIEECTVKLKTQKGQHLVSEDPEADAFSDAWSCFLGDMGWHSNTSDFTETISMFDYNDPVVVAIHNDFVLNDEDDKRACIIGHKRTTRDIASQGNALFNTYKQRCLTGHISPSQKIIIHIKIGSSEKYYDILEDRVATGYIAGVPSPGSTPVGELAFLYSGSYDDSDTSTWGQAPLFHRTEFQRVYDFAYQTKRDFITATTKELTAFNGDYYTFNVATDYWYMYFEAAGFDMYVLIYYQVIGTYPNQTYGIQYAKVKLPGESVADSTVLFDALDGEAYTGSYFSFVTAIHGQLPDDDFQLTEAI